MKKILISLVAVFVALLLSSCSEKPSAASLDVQFRIPSKVSINYDESELEFQIMFGKAPLETDQVVLADEAGAFRSCNIISGERPALLSPCIKISPQEYIMCIFREGITGN